MQATGTCSGTFIAPNGRAHKLNNAVVGWQTTEYSPVASCTAGTDAGTGEIAFQYGTISSAISETTVGPIAVFTLEGAEAGSAAGQANINPSVGPVAAVQACAGAGLAEAPVDVQVATTPSISG